MMQSDQGNVLTPSDLYTYLTVLPSIGWTHQSTICTAEAATWGLLQNRNRVSTCFAPPCDLARMERQFIYTAYTHIPQQLGTGTDSNRPAREFGIPKEKIAFLRNTGKIPILPARPNLYMRGSPSCGTNPSAIARPGRRCKGGPTRQTAPRASCSACRSWMLTRYM